jgi:hypothetical protein
MGPNLLLVKWCGHGPKPSLLVKWCGHGHKPSLSVNLCGHGPKPSLSVKWCGHACVFHIWVKILTLHITGGVTRFTRWVPLVEQELLTLPEHLSSPPVFSGVRVTRSLILCVCFVDRCLSFSTFSFGHCFVCSSLIYRFWLPLWYFQALLVKNTWILIFKHMNLIFVTQKFSYV